MKTLNRYIMRGVGVTFLTTLTVITFIMSLGVIFKITDLLARGTSWEAIAQVLLYAFVPTLIYSVPISVLVASLLVFGRLSADGEITAMKACGISVPRIMRWPAGLSIGLVALCLYITNELAPRGHLVLRQAMAQFGMSTPTDLFTEGQSLEGFGGLTVFIGEKSDDRLRDIRILDRRIPDFTREIRAESAFVQADGADIILVLFNGRIDPFDRDRPGAGYFTRSPMRLPGAMRRKEYRKQRKDMTFMELVTTIRDPSELAPEASEDDLAKVRMSLKVELNKRFSLSLSCLAFVLLGIPLGIRSHRKESSIGIAISLLVIMVFYLFIILAEQMHTRPTLRPDLMMWVPVAMSCVLSAWLIRRQH